LKCTCARAPTTLGGGFVRAPEPFVN
jgi:hypothetical protein